MKLREGRRREPLVDWELGSPFASGTNLVPRSEDARTVATHLNGTRMHVAPPPSPGPRIQELGDTLVVTFRPRRAWGELLFLGFWLTFWTFGGIAALFGLPGAGWGGRVFLLFWLCGWAFGEVFAASQIAWQLAGREFLAVTANQLEVRKQVGRFARTRRLHVLTIADVRAERVPAQEDEKPRTDYRLWIISSDETLCAGEGMGENEAEYVASVVQAHVDPRRRWSEDPTEYGFAPRVEPEQAIPSPTRPPRDGSSREFAWGWVLARVGPALVGTILLAFVVSTVLPTLRHPPHRPRFLPPPAPPAEPHLSPADLARRAGGPPLRQEFDDPRAYASAMTRYALSGARTKVESAPRCGKTVAWTRWTCRARARSRMGPFAGRSLVYRCTVEYEQQAVAPPTQTILCGPEHPPPIVP
jgi:hypothetical protein